MSMLNWKRNQETPLGTLVSNLRQFMNESGSTYVNAGTVKDVISFESLGDDTRREFLADTAEQLGRQLRDTYQNLSDNSTSLGFEELTEAQIEAGVYVMMASGDPVAYARAALESKAIGTANAQLFTPESAGVHGSLDFRDDVVSQEIFDRGELEKMLPFSVSFNVAAARQDEFAEAFYPTTVVSPENGGLEVSIDQTTVHGKIRRDSAGRATDFSKRNILEAARNHKILEDESTKLVPHMPETDENDHRFVDKAILSPVTKMVGTEGVRTSALKFGQEIDLIGLSNHPVLQELQILDHTDQLDPRIVVDRVVAKFADGQSTTGSVLGFNTKGLIRNAFVKSREGQGREMALNFRTTSLLIDENTTALDGSVPAELAAVRTNKWTVRLSVNITGHANTETGSIEVNCGNFRVDSIRDENGDAVSTEAGAGKAFAEVIAGLSGLGYELNAARTNSNRRTRGLLLNTTSIREIYGIQLGSPISAPSPMGDDRSSRDMESLINAARLRNSNNAVTALMNYSDTLRDYVNNKDRGLGDLEIEGIGRHVVSPFYEEFELDLTESMNSLRSMDRAADIQHTFVQAIRDVVYRAYTESAIQPALDASSTGSKKPTLLIGTDPVISRHLELTGESRTFGSGFESARVVTTIDERMKNKIYITFSREGGSGHVDPLRFGTHAWIPELASTMSVAREGAIYQEAMVQPRNRHINNLPIMIVINVKGLSEVMTLQTKAPK